MPLLIQYLVKLSISLAFVWLFYQLFLRKLTFYNSNRWYLLGYTILAFFIPFVNISTVLDNDQANSGFVQFIPVVYTYTEAMNGPNCPEPLWSTSLDKWDWILFALTVGIFILFLRFAIRFISFLRMRRNAKLISDNGVKLYQVDQQVIPFSFGNAVFINTSLHNETELQEIIRHEFVHVKQKHTVDIVWAEILCILCWYNPFVWLIKASIRQNLEFIADNKVLQNGFDKKQYQYLLLKVIGNNHFSIANQFNFSSLKKRIAMMNKIRSARVNLLRFLFILPVLAVILISFRQHQNAVKKNDQPAKVLTNVTDTIPDITEPNKKGYIINIKDNKGECTIVVKDKSGKEIERLLLTKWNENKEHYENLYGKIPPPPPPAPPTPPGTPGIPPPPPPPQPVELPDNVSKLDINNKKATVVLKDGSIEKYDLNKSNEKAAFEKKYGEIAPPPPPPPPAPVKEVSEVNEINEVNEVNISSTSNVAVESNITSTVTALETPVKIATSIKAESVKFASTVSLSPVVTIESPVGIVSDHGGIITGKEDIIVVIKKNTTRKELDDFIRQMKEKGVTLSYDKIEYNSKGELIKISGHMRSKDNKGSFAGTDFDQVVLAMVKKDGRTQFMAVPPLK